MYQIGAFSKICRVSVKTLRHYDKIGLLKPAEVDRFTGYRYYDRAQLERMLLIQTLKRYGFSLEEILSLLLCDDSELFLNTLRQQAEKLKRQYMELGTNIQDLTLHILRVERTGERMEPKNTGEIRLVTTAPMAVLSYRARMSVEEFGQYYGKLYERIARERLSPNGVVGAMYHDEEWDPASSDIELFLGIQQAEQADRVVPPQTCAMRVHKGVYSTLPETYAALTEWIQREGYVWDGAPYDVYTKSAQNAPSPEAWETEVYFPIKNL